MFYVDPDFVKLQYSVRIMHAQLRSPKMPCIRSSTVYTFPGRLQCVFLLMIQHRRG